MLVFTDESTATVEQMPIPGEGEVPAAVMRRGMANGSFSGRVCKHGSADLVGNAGSTRKGRG